MRLIHTDTNEVYETLEDLVDYFQKDLSSDANLIEIAVSAVINITEMRTYNYRGARRSFCENEVSSFHNKEEIIESIDSYSLPEKEDYMIDDGDDDDEPYLYEEEYEQALTNALATMTEDIVTEIEDKLSCDFFDYDELFYKDNFKREDALKPNQMEALELQYAGGAHPSFDLIMKYRNYSYLVRDVDENPWIYSVNAAMFQINEEDVEMLKILEEENQKLSQKQGMSGVEGVLSDVKDRLEKEKAEKPEEKNKSKSRMRLK